MSLTHCRGHQTQCTDCVCCFTCTVLSRPKPYRLRSDRHAPLTIHMCLSQMLYHVLVFAFLIVIASTALMTPILLYVFDLRNAGWMWQHAALFSAMIAPTDAVSVSSILKKGMPTPNAASKQLNTQGPICRENAHTNVCLVLGDLGQLVGSLHPSVQCQVGLGLCKCRLLFCGYPVQQWALLFLARNKKQQCPLLYRVTTKQQSVVTQTHLTLHKKQQCNAHFSLLRPISSSVHELVHNPPWPLSCQMPSMQQACTPISHIDVHYMAWDFCSMGVSPGCMDVIRAQPALLASSCKSHRHNCSSSLSTEQRQYAKPMPGGCESRMCSYPTKPASTYLRQKLCSQCVVPGMSSLQLW